MSTDVLPELESDTQPPRRKRRSDRGDASQGRWWWRGLLAIGGVALVAAAAALISSAGSSRQIGPKLTHTITRGDLVVTVTEHGTLESAENTEIKCKVRGRSTVIWVIEGGTEVKAGDDLVRLDTLLIEESISERTKYAHWSRSAAERSQADVARAELAIPEYLEGRYRSELMTKEKDLAIAKSNLTTAHNMLDHAKMLAERGYLSELEVEQRAFAVTRDELNVGVQTTQIEVLKEFAKKMELETLNGNLKSDKARHEANKERAIMDGIRRDTAVEELEQCVIKAERSGLVIYPSAARWENAPKIEEGVSVHKDQVLLLMPDLSKMQVTIGIHEAIIDDVKPGLAARVTLPDRTLDGEVSSVASVTAPAGWWTGNVVKYETVIELPSISGLKPGMSAEVEVIMAEHEDVLMIPVAAVVETAEGDVCWVKTAGGAERRVLALGDTNNVFTVVKAGLTEGDEVMLNPLAFMEGSQTEAKKPVDETKPDQRDSTEPEGKKKAEDAGSRKPAGGSKQLETKPKPAKAKEPQSSATTPTTTRYLLTGNR